MRKKNDSLREALLSHSEELMKKNGIKGLSMRALAQKAEIATGSIYNYFSCKDEILLALTENYWLHIIEELRSTVYSEHFCEQLCEMYDYLKQQMQAFPGKLMSSLGSMEQKGQTRMRFLQSGFIPVLTEALNRDESIDPHLWNENFSKEDLAELILLQITEALRMRSQDIRPLTELLKRLLYRPDSKHGRI